jgi:hypothetical protein
MPNRYEREIEEILRNMEQTEPKPSFRERLNMRRRSRQRGPEMLRPRPARPAFRLNLSNSEWCFAVGILLGLVAAGWAYVDNGAGNLLTGFLAVLGFICLVMGIVIPWRESTRPSYSQTWRGEPARRQRSLPRPLRTLVTRWKIMRLRMRYRRRKGD